MVEGVLGQATLPFKSGLAQLAYRWAATAQSPSQGLGAHTWHCAKGRVGAAGLGAASAPKDTISTDEEDDEVNTD